MQTTIFKVETKDGRMFKVFCANSKQCERFRKIAWRPGNTVTVITNGIHNIKQFEQFIKTLN